MMEQGVVPVYSCTSQFAKGNLILTLFLPHTLHLLLYKKKKNLQKLARLIGWNNMVRLSLSP